MHLKAYEIDGKPQGTDLSRWAENHIIQRADAVDSGITTVSQILAMIRSRR
jgi:hypothetical protein